MKAAVIYRAGDAPQLADVPEPLPANDNEVLITLKAAAIKHFDKAVASGKHYSNTENAPAHIIGGDGVGLLADGARVFAVGKGMIAEKAVVEKNRMVPLPEGISDVAAAALPNAVAGSAMALRFRANIAKGDVVLISGATGFTGRVAVQIAKHYGAGRVIVTGRNTNTLQQLLLCGADEAIPIQQEDETFTAALKKLHAETPVDIVIDYLWGHTAELIISCLQGTGGFTHKTRYVSVGSVTGDKIQLSAATLRSADIQLLGSGLGSWSRQEVQHLFTSILPEIFNLAAQGILTADTETVALQNIGTLWQMDVSGGKRLVVVM